MRPYIDKAFKEKRPPQVGVGAHFEKVGKDFSIRSLVKGMCMCIKSNVLYFVVNCAGVNA